MSEAEFQGIKAICFAAAFALAVGWQRWRPHRALAGSWCANGGLALVNAVSLGIVCTGCACSVAVWASRNEWGLLNQAPMLGWLVLPASILSLDLLAYAWHRANHRVPVLWRFHQAHHSDPDYTVTTALRFHPGELLLALPIRLVTIAALGIPVAGVILFEAVFAFANFWEHGNIALPLQAERKLGRLFVTPALHRQHHSRHARELDTNYGTIFSLWDRLLGSYVENRSDVRVETGLPGIEDRLGTAGILTLPLRGSYRGIQS